MLKRATLKTHKSKLLLLMVVMIAPIVLSYTLYYGGPPSGRVNYGELLKVKVLPDVTLYKTDGITFNISQLRGKWIMLVVDSGDCGESCRKKLYYMRQARLMQKNEIKRIERIWLIDDDKIPEEGIKEDFKGTIFINARDSKLLKEIPGKVSQRDHIYIVDPLGNLMMRFPKDADPSKMAKDIKRLLKVSQIG